MRDLQERVQRILINNEYARGNDNILMIEVIKDLGYSPSMSFREFSERVIKCELPSIETVSRVRRKVQERDNKLKPIGTIQELRALREIKFREYARETM